MLVVVSLLIFRWFGLSRAIAFLLGDLGSYPHCIHRDEKRILARHRHRFDRDDVYSFYRGVELTSCMLLHTSHLPGVATCSFLFERRSSWLFNLQRYNNFSRGMSNKRGDAFGYASQSRQVGTTIKCISGGFKVGWCLTFIVP